MLSSTYFQPGYRSFVIFSLREIYKSETNVIDSYSVAYFKAKKNENKQAHMNILDIFFVRLKMGSPISTNRISST